MSLSIYSVLLLMALVLLAGYLGTQFYLSIAIQKGILANPNYRTLHQRPVPRGGGIVFSMIFVLGSVILGFFHLISIELVLALGLGGGAAALFGFIDDVVDIRASIKLFIQGCLAAWVLFCFGGGPLATIGWIPVWVSLIVSWALLIWMINLYNFMDGVDGMAISGAIFISMTLMLGLVITGGPVSLSLLFALLAMSCVGFLLLNWPPARVFMGDSGSVFLGYCFGALIINTTMNGDISIWTWLIAMGYFIGDTTTTMVLRLMIVKKWYHAHRSHAYQNLARIWDDHRKVTGSVLFYHLAWLLPLSIWSSLTPIFAPLAAVLALAPAILWTIRFGPRLSSA